jgi:zinc protease
MHFAKKISTLLLVAAMTSMTISCAQLQKKETSTDDSQANSKAEKIFDMPYLMRDLDNGLRVIVVPTDFPDVVSVHIPVQTGSRNEVEEGKSGFAHFFEHMMFHGTENYSADVYQDMLKNAGADQNAYTTDDYTNYHTTVTKEDLEMLLMLEADRFQNLTYTEPEFRTEALAVKGEYLKNSANPVSKLIETIRDTAFQKHTYKHTTMGFFRDIEEMPNQMDYAKTFFDRWYRPEKTAIIVVGDVDAEATFEMVKKHWGQWQRGSYNAIIPVEPPATGQVYKHIKWDSPTQPWLAFAFHGPADDPSIIDSQALDLLLDTQFGSSSELYQELVTDKRLIDRLYAFNPSSKDPGLTYLVGRLTDEKHFDTVKNSFIDGITKARTNLVENSRLDDLKSQARYGFATSMDNSETIAGSLARYVQRDRDPELINRQFETLKKVTPQDLLNVANKYLVDAGRVVVTLSQAEDVAGMDTAFSLDQNTNAANQPVIAAFKVKDLRNKSPIIDINLLFNTGPAFENTEKNGVAALTAAMLTEGGSKLHSSTELTKLLSPIAAGYNNQVDKEMISFSGRAHIDVADQWLELFTESLLNPGFREDDFKRLKQQQINAITTDLKGNNDEELGKEVLYNQLYKGHSYETYNLGDLSELESITLEDVKAFYQSHMAQNLLTVGVTGNLSDELFNKFKNQLAKKLPIGNKALRYVSKAPELKGRKVTIVEKDTLATAVSFGFPIEVNRSHKDWVALWLVRSFFGEHRNSNSHLYSEIRAKRGMNYGDYAYIEYFPRGMYQFHPDANLGRSSQIFQAWIRPLRTNQDAHFATRLAMYELHHLIEHGLTKEQFEGTRNFLNKFVGLLVKSQDRVLGYQLDSDFYKIPEFTKYVKEGLAALTLEEVNAVIKRHLQDKDMQFVFIAKDAKDMKKRLVSEQTSSMEYNSEKDDALLKRDNMLQNYKLNIDASDVEIMAVDKVFD